MALCLETASPQRWKCETLIDHFQPGAFCVASGREAAAKRARVKRQFNATNSDSGVQL